MDLEMDVAIDDECTSVEVDIELLICYEVERKSELGRTFLTF